MFHITELSDGTWDRLRGDWSVSSVLMMSHDGNQISQEEQGGEKEVQG